MQSQRDKIINEFNDDIHKAYIQKLPTEQSQQSVRQNQKLFKNILIT